MVRNIIGSILALAAAAAAVLSPFLIWFDGRRGHDYRVADLINGITATSSAVAVSLLLPFAVAALVTLIGLVLRSRLLVALAGLIVLGFTVLWMVRQGQVSNGLSISGGGTGLGLGVAYALGGGVVLLLAALVMSGRRAHYPAPEAAPQQYAPQQYAPQQYAPQQYAPQDEDWDSYGAHPYGQAQPQPYQPPGYGHPWEGPHKFGPPQYDEPQQNQQDWQNQQNQSQDGDTQSLPVNDGRAEPRDDDPPRH
ncbi:MULTISPECIES: hypothetical protein [unclassified Streptomyces]|uniref:hypothetical protein n=1 Tax=unclassified Streptomyces TaxID=2593676 RepID=UPI00081E56AE|nr:MULTISPECIES: hypothetical protein [unclassified Streptomyces]SCF79607.1 hypothetical protein GA0115259_102704 [Streptomyces sp. MnatMP-M17]